MRRKQAVFPFEERIPWPNPLSPLSWSWVFGRIFSEKLLRRYPAKTRHNRSPLLVLPKLITPIPGPNSLAAAQDLRAWESRNITCLEPDFPVFWDRASGVNVWDLDGNRFLDLTSAFGVCGLGHGHPAILKAAGHQAERLLHGMGDVHPTRVKADLCRELSRLSFERWLGTSAKTILCNSGFEAVEAALKTAFLLTRRAKVLSFRHAYHGLGYGVLGAGSMARFREPFAPQLAEIGCEARFPATASELGEALGQVEFQLKKEPIGAVLVEPIQGRGGCVVPPTGFLAGLRKMCDEHGAVLIFDEIYTGFNRTGKLFACEHEGVAPDLVCLGKALASGFPISACVGRADLMDAAWPVSSGEALHTSTFLGHPVGCAMALASIALHSMPSLQEEVEAKGRQFIALLEGIDSPRRGAIRGKGLMLGVEILGQDGRADGPGCVAIMKTGLQRGLMCLPEGPEGEVLALTPPFGISEEEMSFVAATLAELL